eukprot:CAMPEP_0174368886 /NCGR_PEP_ID=MMETSP0811_2-20130205/90538_1 /TAXON_ID=73025 ORGANISM="Eutreptiella gymnastica-like, Strain CCMP1594" /NCGR_SAMPLE_ID=MMETSP0811_2 /ASSEMBLY_ACC=CAM_ASM_000667 /LENGTH=56 /DNA_ID=CAMNT_0015512759 /DNA_START=375 /DNA_END=545 /DNA_ORIENTATION=+
MSCARCCRGTEQSGNEAVQHYFGGFASHGPAKENTTGAPTGTDRTRACLLAHTEAI